MNGDLRPNTRTSGPARGAAGRTGATRATAIVATDFWGSTPLVSLRHTPDPARLDWPPDR